MTGLSPAVAVITAVISMLIPVIVVLVSNKLRLISTSEDYLVAGRRAHWALAMASITSMYIWGSSVMGSAEGVVGWGLAGVWIYPLYAVGLWVFGIWANKFAEIFPYALSYTQYFRHRFDKKLHILMLIIAVATSFTGAWIQGLAAGHVLTGLTGGAVPYYVGVIIMGLAVAIFTIAAGLWGSLMATWVFTLIAMPICALVGILTWAAVGGPGPVISDAVTLVQQGVLDAEILKIFSWKPIYLYLPCVLAWALFSLPMQQDYWQTAFSVSDRKDVGRAFRHAGNWWFFMPFISGSVGFIALVYMNTGRMPAVSGSEAYASLIGHVLPSWIGILFIWLVFSATVGSVGAAVVAIGNIIGNDLYRSYINKKATDYQVRTFARIVVAIATVAVIAIALTPLSILMVLLFMPLYCAPFVWAFLASQYKNWFSSTPVFIGGIVGLAVGAYMFLGMNLWGPSMIAAFVVGGVIATVGSKIWPAKFDFSTLKTKDELE
ncbi:MAG: hypothetical protein C4554_04155 [Dethiobacter sp.]|jgi:SSS family solute:Na+ symporter|nr:MAG: hypothetical protein C4554_04155 [Dethiobacter sp.]